MRLEHEDILHIDTKTKTQAFYCRYLFTTHPDFRRNLHAIRTHKVYGPLFESLPNDMKTYVLTGREKNHGRSRGKKKLS